MPRNNPRRSGDRKKPFKPSKPSKPIAPKQEEVRLNRFIANAGICSRREADELIAAGDVKVNGKVVKELGTKVKPKDKVVYKGKLLKGEKQQYVLLNKPKDFITTMDDPQNRKTVMALVAKACPERIYPVGRLDRKTTGLLLFTNDGDMAKKLTHPSHKVRKIYQVELDRPIAEEHFKQIVAGIELEDGMAQVDELVVLDPKGKQLGIELHSGKNRIVRRIFEHFRYDVTRLDRVMFGPLTKKDLPRGNWRHLTQKEIRLLSLLK